MISAEIISTCEKGLMNTKTQIFKELFQSGSKYYRLKWIKNGNSLSTSV
jgi:hypothetical protein